MKILNFIVIFSLILFISGCSSKELKKVDLNQTREEVNGQDINDTKIERGIEKTLLIQSEDKNISKEKTKEPKPQTDKNIELKRKIANLIIFGFNGTKVPQDMLMAIDKGLGGVILFQNNIKSPEQLRDLTNALISKSKGKLIIATDQEGGAVQRLKSKNGFKNIEVKKAKEIANKDCLYYAKYEYLNMATILKEYGINVNFAPVVDLDINSKNEVIGKYGRSYSCDYKIVYKYAKTFIEEHQKIGILTSLKHFPGHGSSLTDSHKGFTDITIPWDICELSPFYNLINDKSINIDMIMVGHLYNKNLDKYPASLSKKTITDLLRGILNYNGVVISDDLQMGAITDKYEMGEVIKLSLNAGVDILLFGMDGKYPKDIDSITKTVINLIEKGEIKKEVIEKAYSRVEKLKDRLFTKLK